MQAAATIASNKHMTIGKFLNNFLLEPVTLLQHSQMPRGAYPKNSVFQDLDSQINQFCKSYQSKKHELYFVQFLLAFLAYLGPRPIPLSLLEIWSKYLFPVIPPYLEGTLKKLERNSLLEFKGQNSAYIQIHPLVQETLLKRIRLDFRESFFTQAVDVLRLAIHSEQNHPTATSKEDWLSHLKAVEDKGQRRDLEAPCISYLTTLCSTEQAALDDNAGICLFFLDIDGVLKFHEPTGEGYRTQYFEELGVVPSSEDMTATVCKQTNVALFDKDALRNFYDVIEHVESKGMKARIVLSSSWRCGLTEKQIRDMLSIHTLIADRVIGKNCDNVQVLYEGAIIQSHYLRGYEVYAWFAMHYKEYNIQQSFVVDDIDLLITPLFEPYFIKCDHSVLFSKREKNKIIRLFDQRLTEEPIDWSKIFNRPEISIRTKIGLCETNSFYEASMDKEFDEIEMSPKYDWYLMEFPARKLPEDFIRVCLYMVCSNSLNSNFVKITMEYLAPRIGIDRTATAPGNKLETLEEELLSCTGYGSFFKKAAEQGQTLDETPVFVL